MYKSDQLYDQYGRCKLGVYIQTQLDQPVSLSHSRNGGIIKT